MYEMETATPEYIYQNDYYGNSSDTLHSSNGPCHKGGVNKLGAHISTIYYFMFLISVLGNGLVLFIIHSLPFMAIYMQLSEWTFGRALCKIVGSIYYLGLYSSVLFLTLLTFDRHLAVVYSLGALQLRNKHYALGSCAVVWLVSSLACITPMLLHETYIDFLEDKIHCDEFPGDLEYINTSLLRSSGFYIQLFLFLIFPLVVIVYCYVRIGITVVSSRLVSKFKTVRLIFIIVLLFFICWTPYNIMMLLPTDDDCEQSKRRGYTKEVTRNLAYIYFCFSPIFYTFVGKKFQNYFRQMLVRRFPRLQKHIFLSENSRTNPSTKNTPNE
ncbi:hypothetical protein INR49_021363, partial [Caranx melampygus]